MSITLYDWRELRNKPVSEILLLLQDSIYLRKQKLRDSFILNIDKVVSNKLNATDAELYIYLALASQRNYYDYRYNKNKHLKAYYIVEYSIDKLYMNRILNIKNNEIIFKYEEE